MYVEYMYTLYSDIVTTVVVTRNGRCLVCYAENVTPKEALIVKEWNIMAEADSIAEFCYSFCMCMYVNFDV